MHSDKTSTSFYIFYKYFPLQIAESQNLVGSILTFDDIVEGYAQEDSVYRNKIQVISSIKDRSQIQSPKMLPKFTPPHPCHLLSTFEF